MDLIFFVYLITWKLICDYWFHVVFIRQASGRERKLLEKSKKSKRYSLNNVYVRITYKSLYVIMCTLYLRIVECGRICNCYCVCVFVCVCEDTYAACQIWGCLMNICVAMWRKRWRESRDGWGFDRKSSLRNTKKKLFCQIPNCHSTSAPFCHHDTYINETTSNLPRDVCIITQIYKYTNNHIYHHARQYVNILHTHIHLYVILTKSFDSIFSISSISPNFFSAWWLSYKDGMKAVVADNHPCYKVYIKTNLYIYIYIYIPIYT